MLGLGFEEILLIGAVMLIVVGPERLPTVFRTLGRIYGQLRRASDEMRRAFVLEADRQDAEARMEELVERRKRAEEVRKTAMEKAGDGTLAQGERYPRPAAPAAETSLPDGVTAEEWAQMPASVREAMTTLDEARPPLPAVDGTGPTVPPSEDLL